MNDASLRIKNQDKEKKSYKFTGAIEKRREITKLHNIILSIHILFLIIYFKRLLNWKMS